MRVRIQLRHVGYLGKITFRFVWEPKEVLGSWAFRGESGIIFVGYIEVAGVNARNCVRNVKTVKK